MGLNRISMDERVAALASALGTAALTALTRLQYSPYRVTYRGHTLQDILFASDPKGRWV